MKARDKSIVRYSKQLRVASSTAVSEAVEIRLDSRYVNPEKVSPKLMFGLREIPCKYIKRFGR